MPHQDRGFSVGENSSGMWFDCRSFHSATRRLVSSTIYGPSARRGFGFLCGQGGALAFHLAAVEVQGRIVAGFLASSTDMPKAGAARPAEAENSTFPLASTD
jgi:hypothetical protein